MQSTSTRKGWYDCFWGRWERGGMTWLPFRLEKIKLLAQTNLVSVKDWENLPIMAKKKTNKKKHIAAQTIRRTGRYQLKKSHMLTLLSDQEYTRCYVLMYMFIYTQSHLHIQFEDCVMNSINEVRISGLCWDHIKMEPERKFLGKIFENGVTDVNTTPTALKIRAHRVCGLG